MPGRIEALDQEMKKLSEIVLRLAPLAQQELLNYRTLETQHGQLVERNKELAQKNLDAEDGIRKSILAAETIVAQAREEERQVKANSATLYAKAQTKFRDLEKNLDMAEKSAIRKQLKDLESIAA